jgi:RHS repeat-associated protein
MGEVTAVSATGFTARFTRDALGQELTRDLPGGVHARWHRDRLGRPVRQEVRAVAGAVRDRTYDWEVDDRLRGITDALTGPIAYQHDALGQLVSARYPDGHVELRMPDAVGNLFRTNDRTDRVYGPAGQLLESTDDTGRRTRYTYDPEGNLTSKQASDGETWTYHWNATGHLAEVVRPDRSVVSFGYDALGRRISKTFRGQTTHWVWDGNVPLHEWVEGTLQPTPVLIGVPAAGVAARREALLTEYLRRGPPERGTTDSPITWLFEPDTFAPLARLTANRRESIVTDHLGTPITLLDDTGTPTWNANLTTWGDLTLTSGEAWRCPFRWPGQYEDPETGLHYNRFRYYDPASGQYASQDPIRLLGGSQLHSYVADPHALMDPFGLQQLIDPSRINFSQRTVAGNVETYIEDMRSGKWDWDRSGPLRVMRQGDSMVSYDNRRLLAARVAGLDAVPVELVEPDAIMPGSAKTWGKAFTQRMNDPRNVVAGGRVPFGGLSEEPQVRCP